MKNNRKKYITALIVLGIILIISLGYTTGWFGLYKKGSIEITPPLAQTDIFVDTAEKITTSKENEHIVIPVSPSTHQVIVSRAGYLPWTKKITVPNGGHITLNPLYVTQNATGEIITPRDPEYAKIKDQIMHAVMPTKDSPLMSADKTTSLWVDGNVVFVKTGDNMHTVIAPEPTVYNATFYKDRSDAIIFSAGNTVYAIETDTDQAHIQNIFPVYKGQEPHFIETDPGYIYVLDGTTLMAVVI